MNELHKRYKEYVENRTLYRVVPTSAVATIRKKGLVFGNDPHAVIAPDAKKLFALVLRLEKKGFVMMRWWGRPVPGSLVVATSKKDLSSKYIDFCTEKHVPFYTTLLGGALLTTLELFANEIRTKAVPVTKAERLLCERVLRYTTKQRGPMKVLQVSRTAPCFEKALFQGFGGVHLPSPFGSEAHFTNVINKYGWRNYEPYLTGKKDFYIRSKTSVPAKDICIEMKI